jgi:hypothetical protein
MLKAGAAPKIHPAVNVRPMMRPRFQGGGIVDSPMAPHEGAIATASPGRADVEPTHVHDGSYVLPAWLVSSMGEGNTAAGFDLLHEMFGQPWQGQRPTLPWGAQAPSMRTKGGVGIPQPPSLSFAVKRPMLIPGMSAENPALGREAHGGAATEGTGRPVPINASGGEYVISPRIVAQIGNGDIDRGHRALDSWVLSLKKETANTIKNLPGPAK